MKLSISRETLVKNLKHMSNIVEKRTSIAILSNVRLKALGTTLEMTATDNEVTMQGNAEAFIDAEGTTTVNAHTFFEIISKIPDGVMVAMELDSGTQRLKVSAGKANFNLACLPADAFPDMTRVADGTSFTLPAKQLQQALSRTVFSAGSDETRAYLTGVYFHVIKDGDAEEGAAQLRCVATDGHRLAQVDIPCPTEALDMPGVILPKKCVNELRKIAEGADDVALTVSESKIQAEAGDLIFTSKLINATYPDYTKVIPQDNQARMTVARKVLLQAVSRVQVLSHEKTKSIKFDVAPENLTISANNPDQEKAQEEVKVLFESDTPLQLGFNADYIRDVANTLGGDDVAFTFKDSQGPVLVVDPTDVQATFVVMPMRV